MAEPVYSLPLSYYTRLLTSQYQTAPVLLSWLAALLQPLDDTATWLRQFTAAYDLDYAVGPQLDVAGTIIGQSRTVGFQPTGGVSPVLDDDTYRVLLKARAAQNNWDGKINSLQGIWAQLFPGGVIVIDDHSNMTATVILAGAFSSITQDLITNGYIVPRPEGVLYDYTFGDLPVFGFSTTNTDYIAGFNVGKWS